MSNIETAQIIENKQNKPNISKQELYDNLSYEMIEITPDCIDDNTLQECLKTASRGFGIEMDFEDVKNHIMMSEETCLLKHNGRVIGFLSVNYVNDHAYIFGTVVDSDFHGLGLNKLMVSKFGHKKIFFRTQNQNLIKSLQKMGYDVYYGKKAEMLAYEYIGVDDFSNFMCKLHGKCDISQGVFKGAYGSKMGMSGHVAFIEQDFMDGFHAEEGDSLLVYCELNE